MIDWTPILILGPMVFGAVYIVKYVSENRTRRMLIQQGKLDENVKFLYRHDPAQDIRANIKWGLVLVGIGLALLIGELNIFHMSDEGIFGLMFLFAGISFFIYYAVAAKHSPPPSDSESNTPN